MARALIVVGLVIAGIGLLMAAGLPIGRLPGDFTWRRGSVTVYLPLTTAILASILLTVVMMWLARR